MGPARQPRFDPDERQPDPLPSGRLDPPRRKPPTAIGTATPRPPSPAYRPSRYGLGVTHLERAARAAFGGVLFATGCVAAILTPVGLATVASAATCGLGVLIVRRALTAATIYRTTARRRRSRRSTE